MGGRLTAAALFACLMAACGSGREAELRDVKTLEETMETLRPLHRKLGKPRPGDWLAVQHEPGQTFAQYRASNPVLPTEARRVIYVQPLGEFTDGQRRVVTLTAEFLGLYFDLPTHVQADLPLSLVPPGARRRQVRPLACRPRRPSNGVRCSSPFRSFGHHRGRHRK